MNTICYMYMYAHVYIYMYMYILCIYIYMHIFKQCSSQMYYVYIYIHIIYKNVHTHHTVYQCINMYTYDDLFSQIHKQQVSEPAVRFSLQVSSVSSVEPETPASDVAWLVESLHRWWLTGLLRLGIKRTII